MKLALVLHAPVWILDERRDGFRERYLGFLAALTSHCEELNVLAVRPSSFDSDELREHVDRATNELRNELARLHGTGDTEGELVEVTMSGRLARKVQGLRRGLKAIQETVLGRPHEGWEHQASRVLNAWGPDVVVVFGYPQWEHLRCASEVAPSVLLLEENHKRDPEYAPKSAKARLMNWLDDLSQRRWMPPPTQAAVIQPTETPWAQQRFPRSAVQVIPHGIDVDYWADGGDKSCTRHGFVAVGHMGYLRNAEGLASIARSFAAIGLDCQDATISVASATALHPDVGTLPACIIPLGDVPDIRPLYWQARAALVPSFTVMGAKTTILQAWAAGCPVVTTTEAANSVGATHGVDVLAGSTPIEVARHMKTMLRDDEFCARLAAAGLARVRAEHSWNAMGERLVGVVESTRDAKLMSPSITKDVLACAQAAARQHRTPRTGRPAALAGSTTAKP